MTLPTEAKLYSTRPNIGRFLVIYKKFIKLLIAPYLRNVFEKEHQILDQRFGNRLSVAELKLNHGEERQRQTEAELKKTEDLTNELITRMDSIAILLNRGQKELEQKIEEINSIYLKNKNKRVTFQDRSNTENKLLSDKMYFEFENRFRGKIEDIKKKQRYYFDVFTDLKSDDYILDIGCGRGEFLEVLKERNINGIGIDINSYMVSFCNEKKLNVIEANAFQYLEEIDMIPFGGIVAFHLIEHLSLNDLITLIRLLYKRLKPNAKLIFETPNPTCLTIFSGAFYVDPTHIKPVHPEFLKFILEQEGFSIDDTWFLNPTEDKLSLLSCKDNDQASISINKNFEKLNSFLYSCPDYAIIATKI